MATGEPQKVIKIGKSFKPMKVTKKKFGMVGPAGVEKRPVDYEDEGRSTPMEELSVPPNLRPGRPGGPSSGTNLNMVRNVSPQANLGPQKMRAFGMKVKAAENDESRLSAQEPNKGPASKGSKNSKPSSRRAKDDVSAHEDSDYDDGDGFEDEDGGENEGEDPMERLRNAIKKENLKAK